MGLGVETTRWVVSLWNQEDARKLRRGERRGRRIWIGIRLRIAQEKCAELIVAVSKVIHEPGNEKRIADLVEEAADVQIMLASICGKERLDAAVRERHGWPRKGLMVKFLDLDSMIGSSNKLTINQKGTDRQWQDKTS